MVYTTKGVYTMSVTGKAPEENIETDPNCKYDAFKIKSQAWQEIPS